MTTGGETLQGGIASVAGADTIGAEHAMRRVLSGLRAQGSICPQTDGGAAALITVKLTVS